MTGLSRSRRTARRKKRALLAAALCSASFLTGHFLFGDEPPPGAQVAPSLLSQYLEAKNDLVSSPPVQQKHEVAAESATSDKPKLIVAPVEKLAEAPKITLVQQPLYVENSLVQKTPALEKLEALAVTPDEQSKIQGGQAAALRPTAVSAANDLPFVPAEPLPPASEVRPAIAQLAPGAKQLVAPASVTVIPARPRPKLEPVASPAPSLPVSTMAPSDDENLPPIVPAWAVPRPGTKKKPAVEAPKAQQSPTAAPTTAAPQTAAPPIGPAPPSPMRIELGGSPPASPATLPQPAPSPSGPNKRAEGSPLQRLPQMIEMTPRLGSFQPATTAKVTAAREPSLLPPPKSALPIPMEIRNPHIAPASFEAPLEWPVAGRQHLGHLDDTREER